jgi:hypothetical protein
LFCTIKDEDGEKSFWYFLTFSIQDVEIKLRLIFEQYFIGVIITPLYSANSRY